MVALASRIAGWVLVSPNFPGPQGYLVRFGLQANLTMPRKLLPTIQDIIVTTGPPITDDSGGYVPLNAIHFRAAPHTQGTADDLVDTLTAEHGTSLTCTETQATAVNGDPVSEVE